MAIINQSNILNLQPGITAPVVVHMSEGDSGTKLSFKLIDGANAWTGPGNVVAAVRGIRQDGALIGPYACSISGDVVSFSSDEAMAGRAGTGIAELVLTDSNGNTAGTANFAIAVERATFPTGVTYTNDVSVYEAILAYAQSIPAQVTGDLTAKIETETATREAEVASLTEQATSLQTQISTERTTRSQQDAVLSARMDEFASLPDGSMSTSADAEMVDIRVMASGLTASTAGDAVREQITQLDTSVDFVSENIAGSYAIISDKFINTSGNIRASTFGDCSVAIPIKRNAVYRFKRFNPTVMRWGTGIYANPEIGTPVNNFGSMDADDFTVQTITNVDDDYLYIQLFVNADTAAYKDIDLCIDQLILVEDRNAELDAAINTLGVLQSAFPVIAVRTQGTGQSSNANIASAPYILNHPINGIVTIRAIELNVATAGVLTLGVVKREKVVNNAEYDPADLLYKTTISTEYTGVQKIWIEDPFVLNTDEYLAIGVNTDTLIFKYGSGVVPEGTVAGFAYAASSVDPRVWAFIKTSTLGVNVYVTGEKYVGDTARDAIKSLYSGKKLSILGDSISTFEGYIPAGNRVYYPAAGVDYVTDTWWYKLMLALDMQLEVNESWGGSRVTTTDGETKAGCMTRCQNLGDPDVVIVYMGINDFDNEVALGTWNGSTALPSVTTTFREAYAIMLNKILTAYKTAEVWVCTLTQAERNGSEGFPEINDNDVPLSEFNKAIMELADVFGVRVLHHHSCGLTYQNMDVFDPNLLHPNKYGHSLIANNDIREMDNAVSKRWEIEAE